jgi:hypothetical protein
MPLPKEMIFNVRRAVYTFVASMSSKNNKKTAVSLPDNRSSFFIQKMKKELQTKCSSYDIYMVPRPGFEPGTRGFSVRCSTD